jgi:hypothetical protein
MRTFFHRILRESFLMLRAVSSWAVALHEEHQKIYWRIDEDA